MPTLKKLKKLEGKLVIITAKTGSVYFGRLSDIKEPSQDKVDSSIGRANFVYTAWGIACPDTSQADNFPILAEDSVTPFSSYKQLTRILKKHNYKI